MKTKTVEYWRMWTEHGDSGTWDTDYVDIPADTPDDKAEALDAAVRKVCEGIVWRESAPLLVGFYAHSAPLEDEC